MAGATRTHRLLEAGETQETLAGATIRQTQEADGVILIPAVVEHQVAGEMPPARRTTPGDPEQVGMMPGRQRIHLAETTIMPGVKTTTIVQGGLQITRIRTRTINGEALISRRLRGEILEVAATLGVRETRTRDGDNLPAVTITTTVVEAGAVQVILGEGTTTEEAAGRRAITEVGRIISRTAVILGEETMAIAT